MNDVACQHCDKIIPAAHLYCENCGERRPADPYFTDSDYAFFEPPPEQIRLW